MARGWESKSVEDQIEDARARRDRRVTSELSAEDSDRDRRRRGLLLERARLLREMERGHKRRYLELLERGLAHVESELARLDESEDLTDHKD